jgi:hypothetical protein
MFVELKIIFAVGIGDAEYGTDAAGTGMIFMKIPYGWKRNSRVTADGQPFASFRHPALLSTRHFYPI